MRNPLRILLATVRIVLLILPMAFIILSYQLLVKFNFKNTPQRAYRIRRNFLKYANFILGIKAECEGQMHNDTALYVSNHRSLSDPLILCKFLDAFIIAKAEVAKYPLISTGAQLTGIIYVQRENKESRNAVRIKMTETLASGENVLVYPEGTVNCHKRTLPYRMGTFQELVKLGIPVVPVCLEYKKHKDVWCNRSMLKHFLLQFGYFRTESKIVIGPAMNDKEGNVLKDKVESWTNECIEKIHSNWDSHFNRFDSTQK